MGPCRIDWEDDDRLLEQVRLQVDVQAKYAGYIERQQQEIERQRRNEETALPANFDYAAVKGLVHRSAAASGEVRPVNARPGRARAGYHAGRDLAAAVHLKKRSRAA